MGCSAWTTASGTCISKTASRRSPSRLVPRAGTTSLPCDKVYFAELGQGAVPFAAVAQRLRTHGYRSWITVEQDILPGMGTPKASAQRNRDYLRSIGL